jgi:chromosome segregation ATPase
MSRIEDTVNSIERKVFKLLSRYKLLQKEHEKLQSKTHVLNAQLSNEQKKVAHWKSQYDTLKVANAMLGSDENKRETKLKINALIREIDHCIGQLSE